MKHSDALNKVRLALSDMGAISLPQTVGMFTSGERPVRIGLPGTADIIACHRGRFVAVEVKVDRDRQRPDQANFQAAIEDAGGIYVLAWFTDRLDGVETLKKALSEELERIW
jgi:hypothetical protein